MRTSWFLLCTLCLCLLCFEPLRSQDLLAQTASKKEIAGTWQGALNVGVPLRLVVTLVKGADGTLTGTLISVDQGNAKIPLDTVAFNSGTLHFSIKSLTAEYEGKMSEDGQSIAGTFTQAGRGLPLTFKHDETVPTVNRPQNPQKPYPYTEIEVGYENSVQNVHLAGTLTVPAGKGPFPGVVLITGSGQQDRDESLMGHKPFLVLADYLTRHGIAVLRVDDRGAGRSTGNFALSTTADFATDVQASVAYLKSRKEIDPAQVGLIGHSEGGVIAPMVASQSKPKEIAFIVLMAGTGVNGAEILKAQSALIARAMGAPEESIKASGDLNAKIYAIVKAEPDNAKAEQKIVALLKAELPEAARQSLGNPDTMAKSVCNPWMRYFLTYDQAPALRKTTCPVLAINGSKDLQVPPAQNLPAISAALKAGGNQDFTVQELPGLNHLFQTCKTGAPSEYSQIEETIAPLALETMTAWIQKHTKKP